MVAVNRYSKRLSVRGAMVALIAAAFVALSGLPAQAQVYYYTYPSYYPYPAPYYQSNCSTFAVGGLAYTSCSNPTVYYGYPYNNYYYPVDRYYYTRNYYYDRYGP
ncbi:MAG TPA: hypothetical protein VJT33_00460 [bacterium]|nr:hypothetical protein [bacterium]